MASYLLNGPNGEQYQVDAPDTASPAEIKAYAQKQMQASASAASAPSAAPDPTADMSGPERTAAGLGRSMATLPTGIQEFALKSLADRYFTRLGMTPPSFITDRLAALQQQTDQEKKLSAPLMKTAGGMGGDVLGNVLQTVAAPARAPAAAIGVIQGAIQPTGTNETGTANIVGGGIAGMLGQTIASGVGKVFSGIQGTPAAQAAKGLVSVNGRQGICWADVWQ